MRRIANFPWYEMTEEFEWDDDEFETPVPANNNRYSQLDSCYESAISKFNRLKKERGDEVGFL